MFKPVLVTCSAVPTVTISTSLHSVVVSVTQLSPVTPLHLSKILTSNQTSKVNFLSNRRKRRRKTKYIPLNMEDNEHLVWKDSFYKHNFNVDQCLSEYTQKSDLDSLRKELKSLGDDLQQQMSDILKTETEAIVNLAEYLTNLNFKIESLSSPVCQLREEIMTLNNLIHASEDSCKHMLDKLKNNTMCRSNLRMLQVELTVEDLIKERSAKVFNERCRTYYKPL
ncbi:unnamed protein product [Callosobruchus maculatus]|uniref:Conserved oligomeric Golgi complex subunit 2 n=1 Tax=Callosobruchus maculatus TaxID=64391 RepID=A0A653BX54_CALMS|nr:unnamed protein product [Callosobruchus maculatus]